MTTIHAYTNDQRVADQIHEDLLPRPRRGGQHDPDHDRRRQGRRRGDPRAQRQAHRLSPSACRPRRLGRPTSRSSLKRDAPRTRSTPAIKAAAEGPLKGILEYDTDPIVSSDIVGNPHSLHLRRRPDQGHRRQLRQDHRLVRQRVGLLEPHGRHRHRDVEGRLIRSVEPNIKRACRSDAPAGPFCFDRLAPVGRPSPKRRPTYGETLAFTALIPGRASWS